MSTILVLDENRSWSIANSTTLFESGHQVNIAISAEEVSAILKVQTESGLPSFDIVLVRHTVDKPARFKIAYLLAEPLLKGAKVIVLTRCEDRAEETFAAKLGAGGWLVMPTPEKLERLIEYLLKRPPQS